ncbi:MAG TPA: O-antigen ligase family protein [Bryobacteraceae bacterium]|jgi:O-antigen ligase|nr:O-antigen ligase family protein [Bryobacteraceae bacterium]
MILFYILVAISPMPNHPLFEAPFAGLTVVKWLGIICCGYAIYRLFSRPRVPAFFRSWEIRSFLVLLVLATASYLTLSKTGNLTFNPMFMYFNYLPLFFTTMCVVDTYERLRNTLFAAIAGELLTSLYVIREFQASGGTILRPGYIAGDANYFATCLLLVLPVTAYFVKIKGSPWTRRFCAGSVLVMLVAFTLASSRGGLVGLCAVIFYMVLCSGQARRGAIAIAILLLPMLLFAPASPLQRMLHPDYGDYVGAEVRREFWREGLHMIANHPLTGIGLGNFTAEAISEVAGEFKGIACNTFLEVAAELGIPGFLAYCAVVTGALVSAGKLRRRGMRTGDIRLQYIGQAMQAGLLGFAAAAVFVSAEYQKPFWIMTALTATIPTLLRDIRSEASKRQQASDVSVPQPSSTQLYFDDADWAPLASSTARVSD